jgi:hypothetical protein
MFCLLPESQSNSFLFLYFEHTLGTSVSMIATAVEPLWVKGVLSGSSPRPFWWAGFLPHSSHLHLLASPMTYDAEPFLKCLSLDTKNSLSSNTDLPLPHSQYKTEHNIAPSYSLCYPDKWDCLEMSLHFQIFFLISAYISNLMYNYLSQDSDHLSN